MDKLWRKRKPPVPLDWENIQTGEVYYVANANDDDDDDDDDENYL